MGADRPRARRRHPAGDAGQRLVTAALRRAIEVKTGFGWLLAKPVCSGRAHRGDAG